MYGLKFVAAFLIACAVCRADDYSKFDCKHNMKQSGHDMLIVTTATKELCAAKCMATELCIGFDYASWKKCYLSKTLRSKVPLTSGARIISCEKKADDYSKFDCKHNMKQSGHDMLIVTTATKELCAAKCMATELCIGFDYASWKKCYLSKTLRSKVPLTSGARIISCEKKVLFKLGGTKWDWYHNGVKKNGVVEFTPDNKVRWSNGKPHGSWNVHNNQIVTEFNGITHTLQVGGDGETAVLLQPARSPRSKMILQKGPAFSTGSICERKFKKIGCYNRDWSKVPHLLITDLDSTHKKFSKEMDWDDYNKGLHSLACRCREVAVKNHYNYFAIGFNGECVAGSDHKGLEKMFDIKEEEKSGCINGNWESCDKNHHAECTGIADYDFFYQVL